MRAHGLALQDDQSLPASMHPQTHEDHLEREGKVELASSSSAAASTSGSVSTASEGPDHLDSRLWSFQPPNLILDTQACKVLSRKHSSEKAVIVRLACCHPWAL